MATLTHKPIAAPAARSRAGLLWLTQAISGALLIVLLLVHMVAHHFIVEGGLRDYAQVLAYVANPFVFVLELLFLGSATLHAALGVRAVVLDLALRPAAQRLMDGALVVIAAGVLVYGVWLAFALQRLA